MLKLEQTEHSYYCECWETRRTQEFESWQDFKDEVGLNYDFDYNLLFRFDLDYEDDEEDERFGTYTLKLHHALQRHGAEQWHVVIHNITEKDVAEINEHLRNAKRHLLDLWKEIDTEKVEEERREAKRQTIADLRKYPDWIVRIECQGLGGEPTNLGGYWEENFINRDSRHSIIEDSIVYDEEIKRKIFTIERVFDRLQGDMRNIIRLRYLLPGNEPLDIQKKLGISKATFFRLQYNALICFARALGYIK